MAIQHRRGAYSNFDASRMKPAELAVVTSGAPNTGKAVYVAFSAGNVKKLATVEDIETELESAVQGVADVATAQAQAAATAAQTAQAAAESAASGISSSLTQISTNAQDIADIKDELENLDVETDATLTQQGKPADAKATGDAISALNESLEAIGDDVQDIAGRKLISRWATGFVTTSGSTTNLMPNINASYQYVIIKARKGDVFTLTLRGGMSGRAWAFVDAEKNILSKADSSVTLTGKEITAPEDSAYLVLTDASFSPECYIENYNRYRINGLEETTAKLDNVALKHVVEWSALGIVTSGSTVDVTTIKAFNTEVRHAILDMSNISEIMVNAKGGTEPRAVCFTDASYNVLYASLAGEGVNRLIKTPAGAKWLILNDMVSANNGDSYYYASKVNEITKRLENIEDSAEVSRNLFDKNDVIKNTYITTTGAEYGYSGLTCSMFIPVVAGTTYYISGIGTSIRAALYNSNYQFLTYHTTSAITASENGYIRFTMATNSIDTAQLEVGTSPTKYVPHTLVKDYDLRNKFTRYASMSMFSRIGVIGDSFAAGSILHPDLSFGRYKDVSWIQDLARMIGATARNYATGGLTTKSWLTDENGLAKMLAENPEQLYFLALGINDAKHIFTWNDYDLGTIADINDADYTQNADTFYGNYGKIISQTKAHAPHAILVMVSVMSLTSGHRRVDSAIEEIAEHFNLPHLNVDDDPFFTSQFYADNTWSEHPLAVAYGGIAAAIERLMLDWIEAHADYFREWYGETSS